jgi:hypothetical protein
MGKEADRHIRADPPLGGGVYFLTNLRFFGGLCPHIDHAGPAADSRVTVTGGTPPRFGPVGAADPVARMRAGRVLGLARRHEATKRAGGAVGSVL